ncbi:MAG: acyl carrier protein [Myxococcota bacterium]
MDAETVERQILAFLRERVEEDQETIRRDTALVSSGLIDSMDTVRLATHLERTLRLKIPDEDISVENFDSIARILSYVEGRLGG